MACPGSPANLNPDRRLGAWVPRHGPDSDATGSGASTPKPDSDHAPDHDSDHDSDQSRLGSQPRRPSSPGPVQVARGPRHSVTTVPAGPGQASRCQSSCPPWREGMRPGRAGPSQARSAAARRQLGLGTRIRRDAAARRRTGPGPAGSFRPRFQPPTVQLSFTVTTHFAVAFSVSHGPPGATRRSGGPGRWTGAPAGRSPPAPEECSLPRRPNSTALLGTWMPASAKPPTQAVSMQAAARKSPHPYFIPSQSIRCDEVSGRARESGAAAGGGGVGASIQVTLSQSDRRRLFKFSRQVYQSPPLASLRNCFGSRACRLVEASAHYMRRSRAASMRAPLPRACAIALNRQCRHEGKTNGYEIIVNVCKRNRSTLCQPCYVY